jgi:hypothetical protein
MVSVSTLKEFLNGCITVADGLGQAKQAIDQHRQRRGERHPPRDFIDVSPSGVEAYGRDPRQRDVWDGPAQLPAPRGMELPDQEMLQASYANVKNIDERMAFIIRKVTEGRISPSVRRFAVQAISRKCGRDWCTPEGDKKAEVKALFAACKDVYRYCSDPNGVDCFQSPDRTLEFGGGDCDDGTILICSALESVGFETMGRVIQTKDADTYNHIYGLVVLPGGVMPLDLSVNQPCGWEPPKSMIARVRDFEIPPARF